MALPLPNAKYMIYKHLPGMYGIKKTQLLIGMQLLIRKMINNSETTFEKNKAVCENNGLSITRVQ